MKRTTLNVVMLMACLIAWSESARADLKFEPLAFRVGGMGAFQSLGYSLTGQASYHPRLTGVLSDRLSFAIDLSGGALNSQVTNSLFPVLGYTGHIDWNIWHGVNGGIFSGAQTWINPAGGTFALVGFECQYRFETKPLGFLSGVYGSYNYLFVVPANAAHEAKVGLEISF